jgi:hypothetical protein
MINFRIFLARRIGKRLERKARIHRRDLRDHLRSEIGRIRELEVRSRGLRLYAAWTASAANVVRTRAEDWYPAALRQADAEIESKAPLAA